MGLIKIAPPPGGADHSETRGLHNSEHDVWTRLAAFGEIFTSHSKTNPRTETYLNRLRKKGLTKPERPSKELEETTLTDIVV